MNLQNQNILSNGDLMTEKERPPFGPVALSIGAGIVWAVLMLVYILLWSSNFGWLQNLAVIVLSLLVVGGILGLIWAYWYYKRI
jgi:hypothetical protein